MSHDEYYDEIHDGNTYKINTGKKEKKRSWSTVLVWLYLKTIGRILPKEWNRWAKNILDPNEDILSYSKEGFQKNKEVQVAFEVEIAKNKKLEPRIEVEDKAAQTGSLLPELEREVEELRKQASSQENLQLEIDRLRAQLEVPPKELLTLRDTLQNVKQEREKLEEKFSKECERLEGEINNLKQELAQKVEEIIGLRKKIEEKDEEISELKRRNEELNEANERVEAKNIEQQKTIFEQGQEINRLTVSNTQKDEIISEQKQRIEKLENALKQKDGMIRSFTENNKSLKQQVETLGKANRNLEESLQQKEAELEQVKRENNDLKEKVEKLDSTIRGLEDKVKGLEIAIRSSEVSTQYKDTELESKRRECEALKSEKNDFEQQKQELEKVKGEKEELEEKVRGLNNTILMLQPKLKELTAKLDETKENEDLNNQLNNLKLEYNREIEKLNSELAAEKEQVKALEEKEHTLEEQLIFLRDAHEVREAKEHEFKLQTSELQEKLRLEKVQHEEELEVLRSKLEEAEEGKKRLEEQITGLQVELDILRKKVQELESNKENVQKKLREMSSEKGVKLVEYQQEVKRLDGALTDQRREWDVALNHEKGEVKRLKDIVSQKKNVIKELKERNEKLEEILDEKERFLCEERRAVKQLQGEQKKIPGLTNKIEELQKEKARLEGEKKQLGEVLDGITKEFDEQKELVEQLQSEQKSKQEQIKGLKRQVAELTGQLKTGEAEAKKLQEEKEKLQEEKEELGRKNEKLQEEKEKAEDNWLDTDRSHQRGVREIGILKEENEALKKENEKLKNENQSPQREEPEPQQLKAPKPDQDTVSTTDSGISSSSSQLMVSGFFSRVLHWPEELLTAVNSLNSFLSRKNKALKGSFPELQGQHFCHTVVEKSVTSLSNKNDGRFESKILLEVLESDLNQTAKEIIKNRVVEVINKKNKNNDNEYYDDGNNINAALIRVKNEDTKKQVEKDDTEIDNTVEEDLRSQLLSSVKKCMEVLKFNKKDAPAITDSIMATFKEKKEKNNSELSVLLKEIVVEELVDIRVKFFSSGIQEIASNIRDKLLSKQKICGKVPEERNTYQLNSKIVEKYKNTHHSDIKESGAPGSCVKESSVNISHAALVTRQSDKKSSTPKPPVSKSDEPLATEPKQSGGFFRGIGLFATNRQANQRR